MTQIIQNIRLKTGAIIMALGLLSPLLITFVIASDWPTSMKTVISGLLAFGIPELFMLLGIVVMGKPGYNLIREEISRCFKRYSPPDRVSRKRYYLGLVLFSIPLILGFLQPYLGYFIPFFNNLPLWLYSILDMIFIIGIFVLGGDFWDKLSGLFRYDVKMAGTRS
jgi:hypothetical protein